MERAPLLIKEHRAAHMNFARQHLKWYVTKWLGVVFTDETNFNLDERDGLACYWLGIRMEPKFFNTRLQGGASPIVWGYLVVWSFIFGIFKRQTGLL